MIQRIQSLYLLIVFIASILVFFFPVASFLSEASGEYLKLFVFSVENYVPVSQLVYKSTFTLPLIVIDIFILVLTAVSIFYYKKRFLQIRLVNFAILLEIVLIVLMFFYTDRLSKDTGVTTSYEIGAIFPVISLVFLVLALRGIKKDEKLIRSLNRLR